MRRDVGLFDFGQLPKQFLLFVTELARHFDLHLDHQVPRPSTSWVGHSSATDLEDMSRLCSGRDLKRMASLEYRDVDLGSQRGLGECDRDLADQVRSFSAEQRVLSDLDFHVKVSTRAAQSSRLTLAPQAKSHPRIDPGGNLDIERDRPWHLPLTTALVTLVADNLPFSTASRAGGLNAEDAL